MDTCTSDEAITDLHQGNLVQVNCIDYQQVGAEIKEQSIKNALPLVS